MNHRQMFLIAAWTGFVASLLLLNGWQVMASGSAPDLVSEAVPVWGRKPVLAYFLSTPSLAEKLRREVRLDDRQYEALAQVAEQEQAVLAALQDASVAITADPNLTQDQKRAKIAAMAYNQQLVDLLDKGGAALRQQLGDQKYTTLVAWVERQWQVERQLHGRSAWEKTASSAASGAAARTVKVYATRYDSGGVYTVALPDKCIKLANGGSLRCEDGYDYDQNYSVSIHYENTVQVAVKETGPWNIDDNYWSTLFDPQRRRLFADLPLGMPEAQAAYFDDYNSGLDQYGRNVTSPVAIDLARQVSVDIGLTPGVNDWVEVTFLWTAGWDVQEADPLILPEPTLLEPAFVEDECTSGWREISGYPGYSGYLSANVNDSRQTTNRAEWRPQLSQAGQYRVEAYVLDHSPVTWECPSGSLPRDTSSAAYIVHHAGGETSITGNQRPLINQWIDLGTYQFETGSAGYVELSDVTGEEALTRSISFSAVRFVPITGSVATLTPTIVATVIPTATATATNVATATPHPDARLRAGYVQVEPGEQVVLPVWAENIPSPGLGVVDLLVQFDPTLIEAVACLADPQSIFTSRSCQVVSTGDGSAVNRLHIELNSSAGQVGQVKLAEITFKALGTGGETSPVQFLVSTFSGPKGASLRSEAFGGAVCLQPCNSLGYLPITGKWGLVEGE